MWHCQAVIAHASERDRERDQQSGEGGVYERRSIIRKTEGVQAKRIYNDV